MRACEVKHKGATGTDYWMVAYADFELIMLQKARKLISPTTNVTRDDNLSKGGPPIFLLCHLCQEVSLHLEELM